MKLLGKLWGLAMLIAWIDFIANPHKGIRDAFRVAATPGPNFFAREARRPKQKLPDPLSEAEAIRLQKEGLATLERLQKANREAERRP